MFGPGRNTSDNFHKQGHGITASNVTITNSTTDMLPTVTPHSKEPSIRQAGRAPALNKVSRINQNSGGIEIMSPTSAHGHNMILSPKMINQEETKASKKRGSQFG